ncbi:MAG: NAD-dependent epimerase/dehydratase family protein [Terracidiphilus sp.]
MNLLKCDLEYITQQTAGLWEEARGKRFFITGGSGFFGRWIVESFCAANRALALDASAVVLTRKPTAFAKSAPHLAGDGAIRLLPGDVRDFNFPTDTFDYVVHAASEGGVPPLQTLDTIVEGTRHTLEFARACRARKLLLASSGAVYGSQPPSIELTDESFVGSPVLTGQNAAYGEGKRVAELLCHLYSRDFAIDCKVARCFTFVGAHLPLDSHFAIGNFIGNALRGEPLRVKGDGTPLRSYLYMADAMIWLWTILFRAPTLRPYNLGSDEAINIAKLAQTVADILSPKAEIIIEQHALPGAPVQRYVPAIRAAREELGLVVGVDLHEAIRRTASWYQDREGER